jgi:DDE superfamily endonuclease
MANRFCGRAFRQTPEDWSEWVEWLQAGLHSETRWRLPLVLVGVLLGRGRRTVTSWLRAAGLQADYSDYYYFIASVGCKSGKLATLLLQLLIRQLPLGERVILAIDDTPTRRYGPLVEGAGLHRNPASGPDDHRFVYGHIWVTMALILRHPLWHGIGLPLCAKLYVKAKDVPKLMVLRGTWEFKTKLQLAAELIEWALKILAPLNKPLWLVFDGAYAYRPLLKRILVPGVTVVSRLRKDAALRTLPPPRKPGQIGGKRIYGLHAISLAKRAAHRQGWQTIEAVLYGGKVATKTYKTFLATYPVVGGVIRVVLVREDNGWQAFFCTDPDASVRDIMECFADRWVIEQVFHDIKEVWGAGQQQVRNVWSNIGCFHLNLWMHTLVELWAWHRTADAIRDRSSSPWDNAERRPSHADRRNALRRTVLQNEFQAVEVRHKIPRQLKNMFQALVSLAA